MGVQTITSPILNEATSGRLRFQLVDEDDANIVAGSVTALTLTLYNLATGEIINNRNAQNVLNLNNVTLSAGGLVTWLVQAADTPIVVSSLSLEWHVALFRWAWTGGQQSHEIHHYVRNLAKVP